MSNGEKQAAPVAAALPASKMQEALQKIARWELPVPDSKWEDGSQMSYGAAYGSNGERDYMRQVALDALAATPALPAEEVQGLTEVEIIRLFERYELSFTAQNGAHYVAIRDGVDITERVQACARAILAASGGVPAPALPVVPEGWSIERKSTGTIIVRNDAIGGYATQQDDESIASSILWELCNSMLAAAPELPEGNQLPRSWQAFHSALCEYAELLDMGNDELITDVPKVLAAKLATPSHATSTEPVSNFTATQAAHPTEQDAARYRFLRDQPWSSGDAEFAQIIQLQQNAKWDSAIDAAILAPVAPAAAPADLSAVEVPPLPEPTYLPGWTYPHYTNDQMDDRYREGYAAGRASMKGNK